MIGRLEDVLQESSLSTALLIVSLSSRPIELNVHTKNPESNVTGICRVLGLSSCAGAWTWYASESRPESITILKSIPCK